MAPLQPPEVIRLNGPTIAARRVGGDEFADHAEKCVRGDQIIFYTDGITEPPSPDGEMFGTKRLDEAFRNVPQSPPRSSNRCEAISMPTPEGPHPATTRRWSLARVT